MQDDALSKLEHIGYSTGYRFIERCTYPVNIINHKHLLILTSCHFLTGWPRTFLGLKMNWKLWKLFARTFGVLFSRNKYGKNIKISEPNLYNWCFFGIYSKFLKVDNLRTNHQGVYVLQDNKFRFLASISNSRQYLELAPKVWKMLDRQYLMINISSLLETVSGIYLWPTEGCFSKFRLVLCGYSWRCVNKIYHLFT